MITRINELAAHAHYMIFWYTPYRIGNLARHGISDVFGTANTAGFLLFPNNWTQYGALLNEEQTINYKITNKKTGQVYKGSYTNKHYQWVDKFMEAFANELTFIAPLRRVS